MGMESHSLALSFSFVRTMARLSLQLTLAQQVHFRLVLLIFRASQVFKVALLLTALEKDL